MECWNAMPNYFSEVKLDSFVIMPNHIHGVIVLQDSVGATFMAPEKKGGNGPQGAINRAPTLGEVIRAFKARLTRLIRQKAFLNSFGNAIITSMSSEMRKT